MSFESPAPSARPDRSSWLERTRRPIEVRLATSLYDELVRRDAIARPGWNGSALATYLLAFLVHLTTLTLLVGGLVLLLWGWRNPVAWFVAAIPIGLAILARPRFDKLPADAHQLTRSDAPALFALIDQVAKELGGPRIELVLLDADYTASVSQIGWRHRPVLTLGLPLWNVLTPQERVFLLGHEIGHLVNGDLSRTYVVGSALNAIVAVHNNVEAAARQFNDVVLRLLGRPLLSLAGLLLRGCYVAFLLAAARSGQWAEYLADQMGVRVAGTTAAVGGLRRTLLAEQCVRGLLVSTRRTTLEEIWDASRTRFAGDLRDEYDELLRTAEEQQTRADSWHPPTHLRLRLLSVTPYRTGNVVLTEYAASIVDAELEPGYRSVARELRDLDRSGAYI